jgi:hypothetical protein
MEAGGAGGRGSDSGKLWTAGRLVGDSGAARKYQGTRGNSMVAAARAVMAQGLLATHTGVRDGHGTGGRTLRR